MLRTNLHWYLKLCTNVMWHMNRKNLALTLPCLTATSDCSERNFLLRCGHSVTSMDPLGWPSVYTQHTHTVSNPTHTDCVTATQQAYCYQFGKSCAECSTKVSPLLAQVSRRDLEPELAPNFCCLQVPVLFSFIDHSWFLLSPEHIFYPMQWKTC